jgi:aromatic ring-cleaving dioxygenase
MENLTTVQALEISDIISKQITNFVRVQVGEWFMVYKAQTKSFGTKVTVFSNLMFEVEFTNRIDGQKVKFSKGNFNDDNLRNILENDNILDLIS